MKIISALVQGMGTLVLISGLLTPQQAMANTAGGATIHNVASLSYSGAGAPVVASVDVGVQTVAAAPTVIKTADQTVAAYGTADYTFTVTGNSNGSDSFTLSLSSTDVNTAGAPGISFLFGGSPVTSITLGGSVTSAASGVGVLYIPAGTQSNLAVGDVIKVGGNLYTISAVSNGTPATTNSFTGVTTAEVPSSLTLTPLGAAPAISAGLVPAGTQIGEQLTLIQRVVASAPATASPATHTLSFTATSTATDLANNPVVYDSTADGKSSVTTVTPATTSLIKLVRNVLRPTGNALGSGPTLCNGNTYYTSGVVAKTLDTLEYCLRATVPPGSPNLTGAAITDDVPAFTSYVANSTSLNGTLVADETGTTPMATANAGMAVNSPGEPAGEVAAGESAVIVFRATVQ